MDSIKVTPKLIKELQKFEAKKSNYMTGEDIKRDIEDLQHQQKSLKYYFQHPYLRLLTVCAVTILNFYLFAEDPISHSVTECRIPLLGDIYSFIFTNYPNNGYSALKTFLWLFAIIFGIIVGKIFVHHYLFCCKLELKIFSKDGQGSWIIIFLFTMCVLFYESAIYNAILTLDGSDMDTYHSTDNMHIHNKSFMVVAAIITWLGDFITAWTVLDMILQEKKYPNWFKSIRKWWQRGFNRVIIFWVVCIIMTIIAIVSITTNVLKWDDINRGMVSTNELSRSFLASAILILDLVIIMQDWDFPHFCSAINIKLPGINTNKLTYKIPQSLSIENNKVRITGKWFNYGFLFIVILLDMIRWRNQIFYKPFDYGQYVDSTGRIYTVTDQVFLTIANETTLSYENRWTSNNTTSVGNSDLMTLSTFKGYDTALKGVAFIPFLLALFVFIYLIYAFAKDESDQEKLVRHWYESKFTIKRKSRKVQPLAQEDSDSDSDDDMELITHETTSKFNYYFQHPYVRLLIAYTGILLSWLLIAEDPIGYSHAASKIDVLGNAYSLVFSSYPKKIEFAVFKVLCWVCAIITAVGIGKYMIHHLLLIGVCKFKLFSKGQGSWIIMFATFIVSLYCWSLVFNEVVEVKPELKDYTITNEMDLTYKTFMKGVALLSFFSHFTLVLMVTDTILQEQHYQSWAKWVRKKWKGKYLRIVAFWLIGSSVTLAAIVAISADLLSWDSMSSSFSGSNELGRASLAGFIILFDVLVIMQDWEFPRFRPNPCIKLPGLPISHLKFKLCCMEFETKGKWFIYGLLGIILLIDTYNFKNQLMYEPINYEQFTNKKNEIITITNKELFAHGNKTVFVQNAYNQKEDILAIKMKYNDYTMDQKGVSFLPIVLAILSFVAFGIKRSREIKAEISNRQLNQNR